MNRPRQARLWLAAGLLLPAALAMAGCERRKSAPAEAPIPAVKTVQVRAGMDAQQRTLSGVLLVAEEARLSFAVGGKLVDVPLREGEDFAAGQEIARLDPLDFEREVASQTARLTAATARLREAEETFRRQEALRRSGTVAQAAVERAEAALVAARSEQRLAEVGVSVADENLRRTRLVAQRDGIVTRRVARQFEEIAAGQPVYEVGGRDALEVLVLVPEHLVPALRYGAPVEITVPGLQDRKVRGRIVSIGATAEAGSAFRVKARLDVTPPGARSGMSASVELSLAGDGGGRPVFAVPLSALAFDRVETGPVVGRQATLFVVDEAKGIVKRTDVPVVGMAGNRVFVNDGLKAGERVVTAGVAFLRDGQKVRLWKAPE